MIIWKLRNKQTVVGLLSAPPLSLQLQAVRAAPIRWQSLLENATVLLSPELEGPRQ